MLGTGLSSSVTRPAIGTRGEARLQPAAKMVVRSRTQEQRRIAETLARRERDYGVETAAPSPMAASWFMVILEVFSAVKRTEPSPYRKLQPVGCRLPGQDQLPTRPTLGYCVRAGSGGLVQFDIQTLMPPP